MFFSEEKTNSQKLNMHYPPNINRLMYTLRGLIDSILGVWGLTNFEEFFLLLKPMNFLAGPNFAPSEKTKTVTKS